MDQTLKDPPFKEENDSKFRAYLRRTSAHGLPRIVKRYANDLKINLTIRLI